MMADLDKDTVDYVPNFDETTTEPTVLPTPFPNLLVNGSTGIAVGMATNVPPHNLREVIEGVVWLIESTMMPVDPSGAPPRRRRASAARAARLTKEQKLRGLIERIPGPDFPTGGLIVGRQGIREAYLTGRGAIQIRAKAEIEQMKKGDRSQIVITEIPYQVNKAKLQERIADLVRDKVHRGHLRHPRRIRSRRHARRHRAEARRESARSSSTISTSTPSCSRPSASSCWPSSLAGRAC